MSDQSNADRDNERDDRVHREVDSEATSAAPADREAAGRSARDGDAGAGGDLEARRSDDESVPSSETADEGVESEETDLGSDTLAVTSLLGPERWVQFAFVAIAFATFFFAEKIIALVWERFAEPDPTVTIAAGAIVGLLTALYLYRHPEARKLADEVVAELSQVTWPTRDETYVSTVVVVVTSVIAAAYTGVFDALWSAITDFVYTV